MKFKKGNLVEVLRREHDPYGSWFTGNIISVDGDNYIVRYKLLMDHEAKRVAEKVRGIEVRPLPPSVNAVDENFIKQSTNRNSRMEYKIPRCLYDSSMPVWSTEDNDQCSVASCSFNGDCVIPFTHKLLDNAPHNSDPESAFPSLCGKRDLPLPSMNKVYYIHELELRAYKLTMEALFASGPLSWEQETL
ncbi:hypothetical protein CXB51_027593 [Gossypium anomalum]|uniref:ENT domain-containing protein n=1 Tax=Gossypium anomalum TaxID=47600 RepID=A0A8J5YCY6_9ROSI|nr:hypothetical protein CXB51_027593 [Gossypium anomalum]